MKNETVYEIKAGWLNDEKIGDLIIGSGKRQDVLAFE